MELIIETLGLLGLALLTGVSIGVLVARHFFDKKMAIIVNALKVTNSFLMIDLHSPTRDKEDKILGRSIIEENFKLLKAIDGIVR